MNLNEVFLAGNVCADAEIRKGSKENFTTFNLAVNQGGKDKGVDFVPCAAFGKVGDVAGKYLTKGKPVFIKGRFTSRKGDKITYYGITVISLQFLGSAEGRKKDDDGNKNSTDNPFA